MIQVDDDDVQRFRTFIGAVKLILLTPHGRAGSLFVHGLLDGHPQIISLPYFIDRYVVDFKTSLLEERVNLFLKSNRSVFNARDYLKIKHDEFFDLDELIIQNLMISLLAGNAEAVNSKQLLCALFCSVALVRGEDFYTYRYIAVHLHLYDGGRYQNRISHDAIHHKHIISDFPGGIYFALTSPPVLSLASYLRERCDLYWLRYHLVYINSSFRTLQRLIKMHPDFNITIIDIDDLNSTKGLLLYEALYRFGVKPDRALTQCTFSSIPWGGMSTLSLSSFHPDSRAQKIAYLTNQVEISKYAQYIAFGGRLISYSRFDGLPVYCPTLRCMTLLTHIYRELLMKFTLTRFSLGSMRAFATSARLAMMDIIYLIRRGL